MGRTKWSEGPLASQVGEDDGWGKGFIAVFLLSSFVAPAFLSPPKNVLCAQPPTHSPHDTHRPPHITIIVLPRAPPPAATGGSHCGGGGSAAHLRGRRVPGWRRDGRGDRGAGRGGSAYIAAADNGSGGSGGHAVRFCVLDLAACVYVCVRDFSFNAIVFIFPSRALTHSLTHSHRRLRTPLSARRGGRNTNGNDDSSSSGEEEGDEFLSLKKKPGVCCPPFR